MIPRNGAMVNKATATREQAQMIARSKTANSNKYYVSAMTPWGTWSVYRLDVYCSLYPSFKCSHGNFASKECLSCEVDYCPFNR